MPRCTTVLAAACLLLSVSACHSDGTSTAKPASERASGSLDSAGTNNAVQNQAVQEAVNAGPQ